MSAHPADSATPKGEPWVWFTSLGLVVGLAMVVGLLGLVLVNGFSVFWAPEVPTVKLADGGTHIGQLAQRRIRPGSPAAAPRFERQYQVGLREVNGASYVWVDELKVAQESVDPTVLGLERMENGPAFVVPVALVDAKGARLPAADPAFFPTLQASVERAGQVREQLNDINRRQIGEVNAEMESLRIAQRRAEDRREPTQGIVDRLTKLDARFAELKAAADKVAAGSSAAKLEVRDASGRSLTMPVSTLVRAWEPNRMGFLERVGLLVARLREFLFDEPREANTEGGLMPAIFGTLVMTVFMSLLVTPFGVVAAIYLREYAKDGPVLRAVRICVNNLAGVPSIVFGVFGLGFFVYVLGGSLDRLFFADQLKYNNNTPVLGTGGLLWCSLTLALMTLPVVIVATEEALSAVPRGMREASLAAGASKWQTIRDILLPASAPGILTGVILAMARGAGEVAPLMLVGVVKLAPTLPVDGLAPFLHLDRKFMHLGFHIFDLGFQSPDSDAARPMVFATTLLLIVLVVCLNLGAITIRNRLRARFKGASF
jgi:phosphate transport system permease protein